MKTSKKLLKKIPGNRFLLNPLNLLKTFSLLSLILLMNLPVSAQNFPGQGDDVTTSLGSFRIFVHPNFRSLMSGYPGYDNMTKRLQSPTMFDAETKIGRSGVHTHGDATDTGGASVGTAGTTIADSDFGRIPAGFQGPAGINEVHTEVAKFTLNPTQGCGPVFPGLEVRAGLEHGLMTSPGEVESKSLGGNDFPAESFFNIFVEVDLPALGGMPIATLYNPASDPLVVMNDDLDDFPPRVIYIHGTSNAVALLFRTANPGFWQADDLFGYLVLANHAPEFTCDGQDLEEFSIANFLPEMALPEPFCHVTFESLAPGAQFGNPTEVPGQQIFIENGVPVSVHDFAWTPTTGTFGFCQVVASIPGFGIGNIMNTNNINLEMDFTGLGHTVQYVSFEYVDFGGNENISVNGANLHIVQDFFSVPFMVAPGIEFRLRTAPIAGGTRGQVELVSVDPLVAIQTLRVGGQEFFLDNICALDSAQTVGIDDPVSFNRNVLGLQQNYPNPFSDYTTIVFEIPESWHYPVTLEIFNMQGQLINTMLHDNLEPGKYEITWDGKNESGDYVASGVFLYRITSDGQTTTRKMHRIR